MKKRVLVARDVAVAGAQMRRYIGLDILAKSRLTLLQTPPDTEEVTMTAITA